MAQPPANSLLRLSEADVVRLCGLGAAARGLEYVTRQAVACGQCDGARLEATITDADAHEARAWIELPGAALPSQIRWGCTREREPAPPAGAHACEHVAALLTAWIRHASDFAQPAPVPPPELAIAEPAPEPPRPKVSQPALLTPPRPARQRTVGTLAEELARLPAADLRELARRVLGGERDISGAPEALREAVLVALQSPAALAEVLARLDDSARELLLLVALRGGVMTTADLEGLAARANRPPSALLAAAGILERHALLLRAPGGSPEKRGERSWAQLAGWRIAPEVCGALPSRLPLEPLSQHERGSAPLLVTSDDSPARARQAKVALASPRSLLLALALLARAPAPYGVPAGTSSTSGVSPSHPGRHQGGSRAAGSLLLGVDDLVPARLAELARSTGLPPETLRLARRVLLWARAAGERQPLADIACVPPAERALAFRAGFRLWCAAEAPVELADLETAERTVRVRVHVQHAAFRPAVLAAEAREARQFVLGVVRRPEPGAWYALDALLDLIWRAHPFFLRGKQLTYETPTWELEDAATRRPLRPTQAEKWQRAEGAYLRSLLTGPLFAWGVVDLARDTSGVALAFRLTPLGQFLLEPADILARPPAEQERARTAALHGDWGAPLLVTKDGALAVQPLAAGAGVLAALAAWARPTALAGGRVIYAFSSTLVTNALDAGARVDDLLALIRASDARSGPRAAEAIAPRLRSWAAAYGQTRITTGMALLEARDEATLREALAYAPEIAARCRLLGPVLALVPRDDLPALEALLARRGYHV